MFVITVIFPEQFSAVLFLLEWHIQMW